MANTKAVYTPGPWESDRSRILSGVSRANYLKYPVAYLHVNHEGLAGGESEANGRLIAAAPALLEACKELVSCCEALDRNTARLQTTGWVLLRSVMESAHAVIAQAKGV